MLDKRTILQAVFISLTSSIVLSAPQKPSDDKPKGSLARGASLQYEKAVQEAFNTWKRGTIEAQKGYQLALKNILVSAMKQGDLEESNRINAEIKLVENHIAELNKLQKPGDVVATKDDTSKSN